MRKKLLVPGIGICAALLAVIFTLFKLNLLPVKSTKTSLLLSNLVVTPTLQRGFPQTNHEWTLLLTGDVIPARSVNAQMVRRRDFTWPLTNIADTLKNADLTVINLESPLLTNCAVTNEGMRFCADSRFAAALAQAGVDVANLANNHSLDHGWEGLAETEKHLAEAGIETMGFAPVSSVIPAKAGIYSPNSSSISTSKIEKIPGQARLADALAKRAGDDTLICKRNLFCSKLVIKNVQNLRIGFLGYNAVGQRIQREIVEGEIKEAKKSVDMLIVSVHWGKEYEREPKADLSLAPDDPQKIGRLFIDWGADVVVGNHPHVVQPFDFAQGKDGKDKIIFFALGNTVFDQEWSVETKVGYLAKLHFDKTQLLRDKLEIIPIGIRNYGQAYILEGKEKTAVIDEVTKSHP